MGCERPPPPYLVDAALVGEVEAVLGGGVALHLQDAGGDGDGGQVDGGAGLPEAHRLVDGREWDAAVDWRRDEEEGGGA